MFKVNSIQAGAAFALLAAMAASPALAQAQMVRVKGTVLAVDGATVQVSTASDGRVRLQLAPNVAVVVTVKATTADIKPGVFLGAGARPQADGTLKAVQVFIFPEALRGAGEGHRAWGALPDSTMTNATVAESVESVSGPMVSLKYKDGQQRLQIGADANILTIAPAAVADIKPGAEIAANATRAPDGSRGAARVTIAGPGAPLPM
jgi:hypothetical protein